MKWADIIGHDRAKKNLRAALAQGRLAHAYLFHGEEAIGKSSLARILAEAILCERRAAPPDTEACGTCHACHLMRSGNHPDFTTVRAEGSQIKIDQVRAVQDALVFKPLMGDRKIVVVDGAESLNPEAANCFLKTLEEPPDHSLLILVTPHPNRLLKTILSRCQGLRFDPPPRPETARFLSERRGLPKPEAELLTALTLGRIGLALTIDPNDLKERRDRAFELLSRDSLSDLDRLFEKAHSRASDEEVFLDTLDWTLILVRDLLIAQHSPDPALLINPDRREDLGRLGRSLSTESLLEILSLIGRFQRALNRNLNRTLVLETVLLEIREHLKEIPA